MAATTHEGNIERAAPRWRGRSAGERSFAAMAIQIVGGLLILLQLALWIGGIATQGGADSYLLEHADLRAVLTGGLMIREGAGARLYDLQAQHEFQERLFAPYVTLKQDQTLPNSHPPLESLFAAPFMGGPILMPYILWTLLTLAAFAGGLWLLARAAPLPAHWRGAMVIACCAYHPLYLTLWTGQSSTLVFLGLTATYAALRARREWLAGVGLALAVLKPQLALWVIIMLVLQRRWRALVVLALIWGGIAILLMPILGIGWPLAYLRLLSGASSWGPNLYEYPPLMHNWAGLLSHLFPTTTSAGIKPTALALSAFTVGLLIWAWWRTGTLQATPADAPWALRDDLRWALTIAATLLLSQHLYHHDLTILVLPVWLIAARALAHAGSWPHARWWLALALSGALLPLATFFIAAAPAVIIPSVASTAILAGALLWRIGRLPVDAR